MFREDHMNNDFTLSRTSRLTFAASILFLGVAYAAEAEVMAPLASGFPSQPLTLLVVDEPGSADSIYTNQLVEAAKQFSPVPIRVEHRQDFTNFGTWEALAWIMSQGEKGSEGYTSLVYTVPGSVVDLLVVDMQSALGVGLDDLNFIVSTEQLPYFIQQRADAPWGDRMEDLISYAKGNPGAVRYISGGIGGSQDAAMQWYLRKLGLEVNTIIGGGGSERALTVASGEGDITVSPPDLILPHFDAGRVDVLMMSGDQKSPEPWSGVPNAADMGMMGDPWGQTRGIAASPEVPEENRKWLQDLFAMAAETPEFQEQRKQVPGLQVRILGPEETRTIAQTAYDETLPIMRDLGAYWGK
jgi:tripartite-type tricarboxylate transporter receptor subunit TctC